jgi:hypothetical protein
MLGTMSNGDNGAQSKDLMVVQNAMGDATAKRSSRPSAAVGHAGSLQGHAVDVRHVQHPGLGDEHKCGNYPWLTGTRSRHQTIQAYAVESWGYIRDAIQGGASPLTTRGTWCSTPQAKGNDTVRQWAQDALLIVNTSSKTLTLSPPTTSSASLPVRESRPRRSVRDGGSTEGSRSRTRTAASSPSCTRTRKRVVQRADQGHAVSVLDAGHGWATVVVP